MDFDKNLNTGFYNNLDTNFEQAFKMSEQNFSHLELVKMLIDGNIPEKQIAALKFDYIKSEEDAYILLKSLTGCDGKIREAVALRINQFLINNPETRQFFSKNSAKIFADATIDINGNICRLVVGSVCILKQYSNFAKEYVCYIINFANQALDELDKFIFRDKKYVINKQVFKLYWCLEAITYFHEFIDENELELILKRCMLRGDYTIREKIAQIVVKTNKFNSIKNELEKDENYYVKMMLKSS